MDPAKKSRYRCVVFLVFCYLILFQMAYEYITPDLEHESKKKKKNVRQTYLVAGATAAGFCIYGLSECFSVPVFAMRT